MWKREEELTGHWCRTAGCQCTSWLLLHPSRNIKNFFGYTTELVLARYMLHYGYGYLHVSFCSGERNEPFKNKKARNNGGLFALVVIVVIIVVAVIVIVVIIV